MKQNREKIYYSDVPYTGEGVSVTTLNADQFKAKFGCELLSTGLTEELQSNGHKILKNPNEHIVVSNISSDVGHGVFAKSIIPEGLIVAQYKGENVASSAMDPKDVYNFFHQFSEKFLKEDQRKFEKFLRDKKNIDFARFEILPGEVKKAIIEEFEKSHAGEMDLKKAKATIITAKNKGNFSRFINSLPDATQFSDLRQIQRANLSVVWINDDIYFVTTREIRPGEQLGFDYGDGYWKKDRSNILVFKVGNNEVWSVSQALFNEGSIAYKEKNFSRAINLFKQSLAIEASFSTKFNLAKSYKENGEFEKAVEEFKSVLPDYPDKKKVLSEIGSCYEAKKANPDEYNKLGLLAYNHKQYDVAIKCFNKCLQVKKVDNVAVKYNLACSLKEDGQYTEAINIFQEIYNTHPDQAKVQKKLDDCNSGLAKSNWQDKLINKSQNSLNARQ